MTLPKARLFAALFLAALACAATTANAQSYPSKPLRILVPFPPGGTADVLARAIGNRLTEAWGQQVIVENRSGAGGTIGMDAAKKMPADGYNFVLISNSQAASQVIYPKLNHDMTTDFMPVGLIASSPMMIAAHPRLAATGLAALVKRVQENPGRLTYASCGNGTAHHLSMEKIKFDARLAIVHIPYRGCAPAVVDAVAGQVDLVVASSPLVLPHVRQGALTALAVTTAKRSASAAEIPTVAQSGVPALKAFEVDNWYGIMAPLGTPPETTQKLEAEVRRIMSAPELAARLAAAGIEPRPGGPAQLMSALQEDLRQFKAVVDFARIRPE